MTSSQRRHRFVRPSLCVLIGLFAAHGLVGQENSEWEKDLTDPMWESDFARSSKLARDVLQLRAGMEVKADFSPRLVAGLRQRLAALETRAPADSVSINVAVEDLGIALRGLRDRQAIPYLERAFKWHEQHNAAGAPAFIEALQRYAAVLESTDPTQAAALYGRALPILKSSAEKAALLEHVGALAILNRLPGAEDSYKAAAVLRESIVKCGGAHDFSVLASIYKNAGRTGPETAMLNRVQACIHSGSGDPSETGAQRKLRAMVAVSCGRELSDTDALPDTQSYITAAIANTISMAAVSREAMPQLIAMLGKLFDLTTEAAIPGMNFGDQRSYLYQQTPVITSLLLAHCSNPACFPSAYDVMLRSKGMLVSALQPGGAVTGLGRDPEAQPLLGKVRNFDKLSQQEKIELSGQMSSLLGFGEEIEPAGVGAELLRGEAFIDYYRYSEVRGCAVGESKFAAVVSLPSKPPRFLDLGPAAPIEKAVRTWENEQAAGSNRGAAFGELKRRIWSPALSYIGPGPASVWVSPDGVLNRVPWNAAAVGSNKQIAVLNSAQQLRNLRRAAKTSLPSHPKVLLAGPFDYGPVDDAFGPGFTAIPEDQSEAGVTRGLWEKSGAVVRQCHSNDERSCVNSGMPGSDIVHFSTHAIFSGRDDSLNASGLALHAANLGDAGMLKAADILKLDLRSAKLITLAACSTARGDVIDGQGVIGLQAAFIAAGARAILMSLAPVSYPDARKFIPEFYKNLLSGNGKIAAAQALRQTQEHFAKSGDPVAWMPWILAGEGW